MGRKLEKYPKTKSYILYWHDIEGAVLMAESPYLNIDQRHKMAKTSEKNKKKMQITFIVITMLKELCSGFRVYLQI